MFIRFFLPVSLLFSGLFLFEAQALSYDALEPACRQTAGNAAQAGIIKGKTFFSVQRLRKLYKKRFSGLNHNERRLLIGKLGKSKHPLLLLTSKSDRQNLALLETVCRGETSPSAAAQRSGATDSFASPLYLECRKKNPNSCKVRRTPTPTPAVSTPAQSPVPTGTATPPFTPTTLKTAVSTATASRTSTPTPQPPAATSTPTSTPTATQTPTMTPTSTPNTVMPPEQLAKWELNMLNYGVQHCSALKNGTGTFDNRLLSTYYDAERVFYQIADYTGDTSWLSCAAAAESVYRDQYVLPNNGNIPGYWNFSHGIAGDYLRTGDESSRLAAKLIAENAAYARDTTAASETVHCDYSRETAYSIMAYLNAELVGEARRSRLTLLVDHAIGHLDQWFVQKNAPYVRPFMVALTSEALIKYDELIGDRNFVPKLELAANWLWENTWMPSAEAFMYTDREHSTGGREPAPDLNLLIAPLYAWLYHQTGNPIHLDRADQIFNGGVKQAYLSNGKQFNQSYRWSFDYLHWRSQPPLR